MLKSAALLFYPDPRSAGMGIADFREMVQAIALNETVPLAINEQFDIARNVFAYSWFVYEFTMLAELQSYCVLEMALRSRLDPEAKANTTKSLGLHKLLKTTIDRGFLVRKDFVIPSTPDGNTRCQLDDIPMGRNHLAHGNINLMPQYALMILNLSAKILNKLFPATTQN